MPFQVSGKTAIITGAGSGINLAFAELLLSNGCNVVIGDLALRPEAERVLEQYSPPGKAVATFIPTNVVKWDDLTRLFDAAEQHHGGFDIVCPGAGVFEPDWSNFWIPPGTATSRDPVSGDSAGIGHYAQLDINLTHPIRATQIAITRWLNSKTSKVSSQNPKRIVHISSVAAQHPSFTAPMYATSKAALSQFIRSLERLDEIGIRVNGVAPGVIKTPLWTDHPENMAMLDSERDAWIEPGEVAEAMLKCCVDDTYPGGTVVEVLKDSLRSVHWRNDPGPSGTEAWWYCEQYCCNTRRSV